MDGDATIPPADFVVPKEESSGGETTRAFFRSSGRRGMGRGRGRVGARGLSAPKDTKDTKDRVRDQGGSSGQRGGSSGQRSSSSGQKDRSSQRDQSGQRSGLSGQKGSSSSQRDQAGQRDHSTPQRGQSSRSSQRGHASHASSRPSHSQRGGQRGGQRSTSSRDNKPSSFSLCYNNDLTFSSRIGSIILKLNFLSPFFVVIYSKYTNVYQQYTLLSANTPHYITQTTISTTHHINNHINIHINNHINIHINKHINIHSNNHINKHSNKHINNHSTRHSTPSTSSSHTLPSPA